MATCYGCNGTGHQTIAVGNSFDRDYGSVCPHCGGSGSLPDPRPARGQPKSTNRSKQKQTARTGKKSATSSEWSWVFAILGFVAGALIAQARFGVEGEGVLLIGGISALVAGTLYKQIIAIGVLLLILYVFSQQ